MMRQEGEKKNWCMKKEIRVKCTRCERKERSRGGGKKQVSANQYQIKYTFHSIKTDFITVTSFLQDGGLRL